MHSRNLLLSFVARPGNSNKCCVCNSRLDKVKPFIHCRGRISGERELKICDIESTDPAPKSKAAKEAGEEAPI